MAAESVFPRALVEDDTLSGAEILVIGAVAAAQQSGGRGGHVDLRHLAHHAPLRGLTPQESEMEYRIALSRLIQRGAVIEDQDGTVRFDRSKG